MIGSFRLGVERSFPHGFNKPLRKHMVKYSLVLLSPKRDALYENIND